MPSWMQRWQECRIRKITHQALHFIIHCNVVYNAATIILSANRVGDSFRIVNYAIMLDLGRILSHCTLLHIICHSAPCPHPYYHSTQDGFHTLQIFPNEQKYPKKNWSWWAAHLSDQFYCDHHQMCPLAGLQSGSKYKSKWARCKRTWDSSWELGGSPIFILYVDHLHHHHRWANWGTWDSNGELGSSKTTGSLSPSSIYPCMQPSKWPPRKNYVDAGSRYLLV